MSVRRWASGLSCMQNQVIWCRDVIPDDHRQSHPLTDRGAHALEKRAVGGPTMWFPPAKSYHLP
jgi:hypothetical protein